MNKKKNEEDFKNLQKMILDNAITLPTSGDSLKETIKQMEKDMYDAFHIPSGYIWPYYSKQKTQSDIDRAGNQFACYCEAVYRGFKDN